MSDVSTLLPVAEPAAIAEAARPRDPLIPTVFHENWWLAAATKGRCECVEVFRNGRVAGRLPYLPLRDFGITRCVMPPFTHFLGPAICEGEGSADTRFLARLSITRELIRKLPRAAKVSFTCHRGMSDALPFQMEGFAAAVQFTCEIRPQAEDVLWQSMHHKKRSVIRRAQKRVDVERWRDPAAFTSYYMANLTDRRLACLYDMGVAERLIQEALTRGAGDIYAARGRDGKTAGAIFCVWDAHASYYLMTSRELGAHTGVISLLVWEAIRDAAVRGLVFDFDGYASPGSVMFTADFGGTVVPRYIVWRTAAYFRLYRALAASLRRTDPVLHAQSALRWGA